jgi:hypothetical protein
MHNCKELKRSLGFLALESSIPFEWEGRWGEIQRCPRCAEEFALLKRVVQVTDQATEAMLPPEGFWPGYHERLKDCLSQASAEASAFPGSSRRLGLARIFGIRVQIPITVVVALMLLWSMSVIFAFGLGNRVSPTTVANDAARTITKVVEQPVVQEKTVVRTVYIARKPTATRPTYALKPNSEGFADEFPSTLVLARQDKASNGSPLILADFKPASSINLRVIKGNQRDER